MLDIKYQDYRVSQQNFVMNLHWLLFLYSAESCKYLKTFFQKLTEHTSESKEEYYVDLGRCASQNIKF